MLKFIRKIKKTLAALYLLTFPMRVLKKILKAVEDLIGQKSFLTWGVVTYMVYSNGILKDVFLPYVVFTLGLIARKALKSIAEAKKIMSENIRSVNETGSITNFPSGGGGIRVAPSDRNKKYY